jgi:type VI secretion system protein ImpK
MPSLFGDAPAGAASTFADSGDASRHARTLLDLLYDGFFMLFLLRNGQPPDSAGNFLAKVRGFLDEFDRGAKRLHVSADDVFDAKYAFCAAIDETILASDFACRRWKSSTCACCWDSAANTSSKVRRSCPT